MTYVIIINIVGESDLHYDFCGKCNEPGRLICCETCSSAYHYECLGYDRFPRGKFKCYFCKIVKLGIDNANTVDKSIVKLITELITFNKKTKWQYKAEEFMEVIKAHHCSVFFRELPPEGFVYEHGKEIKWIGLVEERLKKNEYPNLIDFIHELSLIWSNAKDYYRKHKSFMKQQAETMDALMTHLIREEGIFDNFTDQITRTRRVRGENEDNYNVDEDIEDDDEEGEECEDNEEDNEESMSEHKVNKKSIFRERPQVDEESDNGDKESENLIILL
jgi:hypothetical protein